MDETGKLRIKFDGLNLESGHIDAIDFAHTVTSTADILRCVAKDVDTTKGKDIKVELVAINKGSFEVDLAVTVKGLAEISPAFIPMLSDPVVISSVSQVVDTMKSLINVKKFLQGEKPSRVEIVQKDGSPHVAIHRNSGQIYVNVNTYNLLQNATVNKKLHKMVEPMLREDTDIESIEITGEKSEPVNIIKEEAPYFEKYEELQTIEHRVRGTITALDRKTYNGKISVGDKRVNFDLDIDDIKRLDLITDSLIDSMKNKIAIMVAGEAVFDFESNLKHIKIKDVIKDEKLFG